MANVVIKKGQEIITGTASDFDGNYTISSLNPGTYTVEYSFVGFQTKTVQRVKINESKATIVNIKLQESNAHIEEAVLECREPIIDPDHQGSIIHMGRLPRATYSTPKVRTPKTPELTSPIQSIVDDLLKDLKQKEISNPEFKINLPFTILADRKETDINIKTLRLPAEYCFTVVPKIQEYAFLKAQIPDWTTYHFLSGKANIYLKGKFISQTYIDIEDFSDTLDLQLGKDTDIQIKRTFIEKLGRKSIHGNKIKETIAYSIIMKNNKKKPINIVVEDQIPITNRQDITIELLENDGAKIIKNEGLLTWNIELKPGIKKEINFSYLAKYPNFSK